ncbi:4-hydroxyphenylacetate 3-hydroxylase N-terminal domain-containing protein [Ramlibacter sp.]|uniref:4-hydroxyphenylacetate 3-hydroxylase N-terminal domain-containing protein n=1 Tax=Ramlibacter sp. TaxID=1917967 RepID=UPI003D09CDE0
MTGQQYRASLADGRKVYFRGERIDDVTTHPTFARQVDLAARGYDRLYSADDNARNDFLSPPKTVDALRQRADSNFDFLTAISWTTAMTLLTAADRIESRRPQGSKAMRAYVQEMQRRDLRVMQCITDAKGDRSLPPSKQPDPDSYMRVVERRPDGVVVRGAKLHIALAPIAHEVLVVPTKAMKPDEGDYSIAFAIPVNAPGLKIVNVGSEAPGADPRDHPLAAENFASHSFVIFDDVFVPNDRIFLDGETDCAASFAHALGLWIRIEGLVGMVVQADLLVGLAQLITEANGLEKTSAIKEKITDMVIHASTLRATLEASLAHCRTLPDGTLAPDELFANVGKYIGAAEWNVMVRHLHDIAGGSVQTAPSMKDLDNPETGPFIRKYMSGKDGVDGEYRLKLFHAIRDATISPTGVYRMMANLLGGGGLNTQRIVTYYKYDMKGAKQRALEAAGLAKPG